MLDKKYFDNAWRGISFDPEKLAEREYNIYSQELKDDLEIVEDKERYIETYRKYLYDWLYTESTCMSWFITGPANFPVERNRKRMEFAMNKYNKFREVRTKILTATKRINLTVYEELEQNKEQMKNLKERQQYYKDINKSKILQNNDIPEPLKEWTSYKCIPAFEMTSIRNKIKTREQRIKDLEKKIYLKENEDNPVIFKNDNLEVVKNYQDDRLQLLFSDKPSAETIKILKSKGFRWSPKNSAWQRQLTANAIYSFKFFILNKIQEVTQ